MKNSTIRIVIAVSLGLLVGFLAGQSTGESPNAPTTSNASTYYCSMHPEVRSDKPGLCWKCKMDLIPLQVGSGDDAGPRALFVSDTAAQLAGIETGRVERRHVKRDVRLSGQVSFDESRVKTISAWIAGRLDRLYVDYTGVLIRKGEHLAEIYSPEMLGAQQALIEARREVDRLQRGPRAADLALAISKLSAVREKLRLWGLTREQIDAVAASETPSERVVVNAPAGGVVTAKLADQYDYVETGKPIYKIADLSQLWVVLDAYESDLAWLRYGQDVSFTVEAYGAEAFRGRVTFIDWVVDEKTHTVKVRVNVPNGERKLKPGMLVRANVRAELNGGGRVMEPDLAGKWVSPMHPEIVKDKPGDCDVCGMKLVRAEELFSTSDATRSAPLVVPSSAVLLTGRRAIVYVKKKVSGRVLFEGREVELGVRAGDDYIVRSGLEEGDEVALRGAFKIDSALQILAKPSLMSAGFGGTSSSQRISVPTEFSASLGLVFERYFAVSEALSRDSSAASTIAAHALSQTLQSFDTGEASSEVETQWAETSKRLTESLSGFEGKTIDAQRKVFSQVSQILLEAERSFGHRRGEIFEVHCPMAFDNAGANWLQPAKAVENPYFGASMFNCGKVVESFQPIQPASSEKGDGHDHP